MRGSSSKEEKESDTFYLHSKKESRKLRKEVSPREKQPYSGGRTDRLSG